MQQKVTCFNCKKHLAIPTNNPLVEGLCETCLQQMLDPNNIEHFTFWARTYNYPVKMNLYLRLLTADRKNIFTRYAAALEEENEISFEDSVSDVWKMVQEEWVKVNTHEKLLAKVATVKEAFVQRAQIKWGSSFSFAQLLQLENLFNNTIKAFNLTNPLSIDAVKKACKISVQIDDAIESGDGRNIKDLTAAYKSLLALSHIDELADTATEGTIKTVSDLFAYMEANGFKFKFYNNEERDIVDKTINDFKEIIRDEVQNATGLDVTLNNIRERYIMGREETLTDLVVEHQSLDSIFGEDSYAVQEQMLDEDLANEELEYDDDE